jgi:hypothetical protein
MGVATAFLVFLILLTAASFLGWVHDSRDGADWHPTDNGVRIRRGV